MKQILTKDLSIIQGPPGTGKTHVSKVALQILVENRAPDDPPIIVAAQTNHALDQLLKHVSKFDSEYIRLGGRSKDEEVKRRALFEVRQANKLPPIPSSFYGLSQRRQEQQAQVLIDCLASLSPREARNPFSAEELCRLGVISQKQADSLVAGAKQWVTGGTESSNETKSWLGKALIPWKLTYKEESFGFEEAEDDLEFDSCESMKLSQVRPIKKILSCFEVSGVPSSSKTPSLHLRPLSLRRQRVSLRRIPTFGRSYRDFEVLCILSCRRKQ